MQHLSHGRQPAGSLCRWRVLNLLRGRNRRACASELLDQLCACALASVIYFGHRREGANLPLTTYSVIHLEYEEHTVMTSSLNNIDSTTTASFKTLQQPVKHLPRAQSHRDRREGSIHACVLEFSAVGPISPVTFCSCIHGKLERLLRFQR